VKRKVVSEERERECVYVRACEREIERERERSKMVFLTPPHQGTTPQILKLKFPVHTSGPKQKRK
jgi:hypothetical protein